MAGDAISSRLSARDLAKIADHLRCLPSLLRRSAGSTLTPAPGDAPAGTVTVTGLSATLTRDGWSLRLHPQPGDTLTVAEAVGLLREAEDRLARLAEGTRP